ncbi:hypothetical protein WCD74_23130 [Actinomycetospora sp. OC33-EN08]|uniref:Uncharacterized protein n=1 Tax=Actinomycetospora aurantiaca TaxID=3129233 RepID=A0ABU8MVK0_9PSEU
MPSLPSVLVVPARPDDRGREAASRAVDLLAGLADARVADPSERTHPGAADHVVVLDPARWRAPLTRHPALTAPAGSRDRLAVLRALRDAPGRVRWIGRPDQWEDLRAVLLARASVASAVLR